MILLIDNYDSFTYNLAQYIGESICEIKVLRNNKVNFTNLQHLKPTHIILSPGPGHPEKCKTCIDIINYYADRIPILGVCLGHQCIGYNYGALIKTLNIPIHGKISSVYHNSSELFNKISNPFKAARYHSLIIDSNNLPNNLEPIAWTSEGIIMACQHKKYQNIYGIQFHPESIWTDHGKQLINNFLKL